MLNGKRTYITETTATVPESQVAGELTITNQTSNGFDVVVTNVSGGGKEVKEVRVPIWSDKNGQDDLTWYHADKQSDGSYKVHVRYSQPQRRCWNLFCASLLYVEW